MPKFKKRPVPRDPTETAEHVNFRLPAGFTERMEKIAKERNWTRIRPPWHDRSSVLREALRIGLEVLEERHALMMSERRL